MAVSHNCGRRRLDEKHQLVKFLHDKLQCLLRIAQLRRCATQGLQHLSIIEQSWPPYTLHGLSDFVYALLYICGTEIVDKPIFEIALFLFRDRQRPHKPLSETTIQKLISARFVARERMDSRS